MHATCPPLLRPVGIDIAATPCQPLTWPSSTPTTRGQRPAYWTSPQQNIAVISCLQIVAALTGAVLLANRPLNKPMAGAEYRRFGRRSVYNSVPSRLQNRKQMQPQRRISSHWPFIFCSWLEVLYWFALRLLQTPVKFCLSFSVLKSRGRNEHCRSPTHLVHS